MTAREKVEVRHLKDRFDTMEDKLEDTSSKIDRILMYLEDDSHSEAKGLVTRVIDLEKDNAEFKISHKKANKVAAIIQKIAVALAITFGGMYIKSRWDV
jgi:hypothetical protein